MIDGTGNGNSGFKARFVGQGDDVECPVGKGLAVAARGGVRILAKASFTETTELKVG